MKKILKTSISSLPFCNLNNTKRFTHFTQQITINTKRKPATCLHFSQKESIRTYALMSREQKRDYEAKIRNLVKSGNLNQAVEIVEYMIEQNEPMNTSTWNTVFETLFNEEKTHKIFKLFQDMRNLRATPDLNTYNVVFKAYLLEKQYSKVDKLLESMKANDLEPDSFFVDDIVETLIHWDDYVYANVFMEKMRDLYGIAENSQQRNVIDTLIAKNPKPSRIITKKQVDKIPDLDKLQQSAEAAHRSLENEIGTFAQAASDIPSAPGYTGGNKKSFNAEGGSTSGSYAASAGPKGLPESPDIAMELVQKGKYAEAMNLLMRTINSYKSINIKLIKQILTGMSKLLQTTEIDSEQSLETVREMEKSATKLLKDLKKQKRLTGVDIDTLNVIILLKCAGRRSLADILDYIDETIIKEEGLEPNLETILPIVALYRSKETIASSTSESWFGKLLSFASSNNTPTKLSSVIPISTGDTNFARLCTLVNQYLSKEQQQFLQKQFNWRKPAEEDRKKSLSKQ